MLYQLPDDPFHLHNEIIVAGLERREELAISYRALAERMGHPPEFASIPAKMLAGQRRACEQPWTRLFDALGLPLYVTRTARLGKPRGRRRRAG